MKDGDGVRVLQLLLDGSKTAYADALEVTITGTQRITYTQGWDRENRLTVVTNTAVVPNLISKFVYDGDGSRVLQIQISGTQAITTAYAGSIEVQITSTQRITKSYYSAGSQLIAMRQFTSPMSSVLYFLHSDHLGSTSLTTDNNGNPVARQLYDAWGNVRYVTGTLPTDIGYTGQRLDTSTGLMYYRARYYAQGIGRFISADTIVPDSSNPQSSNRFSYTRNNPLKYTDPSGHDVDCGVGDTHDCKVRASSDIETQWGWDVPPTWDQLTPYERQALSKNGWTERQWNSTRENAITGGGRIVDGTLEDPLTYVELALGARAALKVGQLGWQVIKNLARGGAAVCAANDSCRKTAEATVVRGIQSGEKVRDLINEVAERTFTSGNEHAIISTNDGQRLIVQGGELGIRFGDYLRRVILHTHPFTTGPSSADFQILVDNGQISSWVYELFGGGLTKFWR